MSENNKIIKSNLKTLLKRYSKTDVVSNIEKNYSQDQIKLINLNDIFDSSFLKNVIIPKQKIDEMETSVKENGIITPLIVREISPNKYEIVKGRKRYYALKRLKKYDTPCIIKEFSDEETLIILLLSEKDLKDSDVVEIAYLCDILKKKFNYKNKDLGELLKQSPSQVSNILQLLNLNKIILNDISRKRLSYGQAKAISRLSDVDLKIALEQIYKNNLSVRDTEKLVSNLTNKTPKEGELIIKDNDVILRFSNSELRDKSLKRINKLIKKKKIVL
ncbi:MAG: ParB/RepB/Spo0J family partition protein [Bacilli bacterium]